MMDWNCSGLSRRESRRYSNSVRIVFSERFAAAGSILLDSLACLWKRYWYIYRGGLEFLGFCPLAKAAEYSMSGISHVR